ncbi:MAG: ABC transporter ATP-binding protein [Aggregatilineales bacterium]
MGVSQIANRRQASESKPTTPVNQDNVSDRYLLQMLGRFLRPYWKQLALVFALLLGVTLLTLLPPYLVQRVVDGPLSHGDLTGLLPYGLIYFGSIVTIFFLRFGHTYLLQTVGQTALMNIRQVLFEHILLQDMAFFNSTPVGQIVSRLSNDIDALTQLLSTSIVMVASNSITLIGIVIVMFLLNWRLAFISLTVMPVMLVSTNYFKSKIRAASNTFHKIMGEYLAFLNEQFGGMLIVQLFGRQFVSREEFAKINADYQRTNLQLRDQYTIYASILQLLTTTGLALVLYGGGQGVLAGWATLGMLISFLQYTQRSFDPILQLSDQFSQIQTALAAGERIARMLKVWPTIQEASRPKALSQFHGQIDIDHVNFSYTPGTPVLREVSIHIPAGQSVAVVGATGAGKTSLVGLLARFYDVTEGRILIDGIDLRDLALSDLRDHITVVPQNPYCFNGTIADNLRLFDDTIIKQRMIEAAQMACAAPFIEQLPGEYDYKLLPGAANLSHGQRQLLALARALLHNPHGILVLDEATSNIDTETEALIQEGLRYVLRNRTSVIIAHRLSTVREVDRILVMQRGKVVEEGNHESLLARNGVYAQLYRRQFLEMSLEEAPIV